MGVLQHYRARIAQGEIKADAAQESAARKLDSLAAALKAQPTGIRRWFSSAPPPRGLYLWGDVGRGKSMLMDIFFDTAPEPRKRRVHFNAFMAEIHAAIHEWRMLNAQARARRPEFVRGAGDDPIPPVARRVAGQAKLLCFDEFQVTDVADAMILGRLFEQLFAAETVIVSTSNTSPQKLYDGGLNRQLFLPFIALIEQHMEVLPLQGVTDYRLTRHVGLSAYLTPLGPQTDARMDEIWLRLSGEARGEACALTVLGRKLQVPQAANGVARFAFADLCAQPLAANDYLAIAHTFDTVLIDNIPALSVDQRNEARRFTLLIDTLYDEHIKLFCSAAAPPAQLYVSGDGAESFRRTASRLVEMQSDAYLAEQRPNRAGAPQDTE